MTNVTASLTSLYIFGSIYSGGIVPIPAELHSLKLVNDYFYSGFDTLSRPAIASKIGIVDYLSSSEDLDPEIAKMLTEDFWDFI